jgi:hypothetical protein
MQKRFGYEMGAEEPQLDFIIVFFVTCSVVEVRI